MNRFHTRNRHRRFQDERWYDLIVILDDATSEIYYAQLVEEESTLTVMAGLMEVVERKGVFCALYSDRGSHFWLTPKVGGKVDAHRLTQVGRALRELDIQMIPAYSPQARGRGERNFGTWQGRLPQELRYFTANVQNQTGQVAAALENYRHASAIRNAALQSNPKNLSLRTHLGADYTGIARCLALQHDLAHAIEMQAQANAILDGGSKANPSNVSLAEFLGEGTTQLGTYQKEHGETTAALETFRRANTIFGGLSAADPKNSLAKANFSFSKIDIADCQLAMEKPALAAKTFRESIATFEEMSPTTANTRYPRSGLAKAYAGLADAYSGLASERNLPRNQARAYWQEAHSDCQKSLSVWNDKEKRGELDSDEREAPKQAAQCVANTEAQLLGPAPKQASLH